MDADARWLVIKPCIDLLREILGIEKSSILGEISC